MLFTTSVLFLHFKKWIALTKFSGLHTEQSFDPRSSVNPITICFPVLTAVCPHVGLLGGRFPCKLYSGTTRSFSAFQRLSCFYILTLVYLMKPDKMLPSGFLSYRPSDCIVVATKSFLITCCAFFFGTFGVNVPAVWSPYGIGGWSKQLLAYERSSFYFKTRLIF